MPAPLGNLQLDELEHAGLEVAESGREVLGEVEPGLRLVVIVELVDWHGVPLMLLARTEDGPGNTDGGHATPGQ